jgi:cell division protein ZapE
VSKSDLLSAYRARIDSGQVEADPAQEHAAERLAALADALAHGRGLFGWGGGAAPKGIYLYGPVGRGKSMLMDLFYDHAPARRKRRVHFHEFMLEIHADIADLRAKKEGDPITPIADAVAKDAHLLCFDELHVTDIGDAMILGRLFERLFARGVVMVATSNRHPSALYKDGINRQLFLPFIDMIMERLDVLCIDGPRDYRLERLEAEPVWHTPLGPDAKAALDRAWRRLTFDSKPRPLKLDLRGRTLLLPCFAAGVARASFSELCGRPLGAEDYLSLAHAAHTLILDNVPRLSPENRSEAARFVTLIDALYETRTKLVASAEAEPNELYVAGEGAFEFERCASRLMEMRSRQYLSEARSA